MICPKCGENIADSAKFCTKCGCNIPEALEEKKKIEAEEMAKKKVEEEKQKIDAEKATAKATENENKKDEKAENVEKLKEKPMKTKKKHTGLKIIIILILLLIIACVVIYALHKIDLLPDSFNETLSPAFEVVDGWFGAEKEDDNKDEKKDNNKDDKKEDEDTKNDEKKVKKVDEDEDLVYDHYNKKILGNIYKVPEINLDYDDVKSINKKIAKLVDSDLKDLEKETELPEMAPVSMDYIWTQNDNILSLVFFIHGYHMDYYYVYNIDIYTGEEIENEDILKEAKIDEDDFASMCSKAVEDYYENYLYYKGIEDEANVGSEYKKAKSESIKESNFDVSKTKMFLNKNGEVTIISKLTTIAGAGIAYAPVNIENLKRNSKPLFEVKDIGIDSANKTDSKSNKKENETTNETTNTSADTTNSTNTTDVTNSVR